MPTFFSSFAKWPHGGQAINEAWGFGSPIYSDLIHACIDPASVKITADRGGLQLQAQVSAQLLRWLRQRRSSTSGAQIEPLGRCPPFRTDARFGTWFQLQCDARMFLRRALSRTPHSG